MSKATNSFEADKPAITSIRNAMSVFSSPDFYASCSITYTDADTKEEKNCFMSFNAADPEFKQMLNDWGARKMGELHTAGIQP